MIIQNQLPDLLLVMGFTQKAASYIKTIGAATLEVNTAKQEIIYPQGIVINERQTCNFSSNENFVVLECVNRLLEKGYKPEHIELEPKWKVGHGASGGRADILVKDNSGHALLIIECKTAGLEFKKAWNKTLQDGDQLFSYAQQISETQFLCLYASDFEAGTLSYQSHLIAHRDNPKYLEENPGFKSFKDATDVKERFAVWRETYKLDYRTQGLFEPNIQPYHVGKDKYTLADLHGIAAADQQKKYHEFATILRQHNVSGRENAFDKLINLFLCKLVDETENPHDLKFYWKGVAFDTHFDLIDRLQQLYQKGMGKFLGETITYIDQSAVQNAMRFIRQNPDATQKAVWNLFLQQKFFTNNDFSLIDVHNEKLFYQNADVLLKILQMWQDIRLTNTEGNHQFLGDMFEGFLDQGVKQSEGQYFTPMPICRFIFMSLPLQSMVQEGIIPKAIDYACGAGHFLNELALQIKPLITQHWQGDEADLIDHHKLQHRAIYGIEKEYRLSKVAKVSAFMYGQQEINICYGDGLVQQHAAFPEIENNSFDLLVANPPYSVRGFLETLPEEERAAYDLTDTVDKLDSCNSIEAFFIERAKQLLKAGGVAAIILPSSILSNGSGIYIRTREILLKYFDLVAVAELGSGTFGKTGTNTVTLFLRRKKTLPDTAEHYRERVAEWFNTDDGQVEYQDAHLIEKYAAHVGVTLDDYKTLLSGDATGPWTQAAHFEVYTNTFNESTEVKNLYKQKAFKALSETEQTQEFDKRYLRYVQDQEREKLYYFVLAIDQPNPVLVIKSPSDSKAQKIFLGYEWSASKGNEGIKLIKNSQGFHVTPMYDERNRDNFNKLNKLISDNYDDQLDVIPSDLSDFVSVRNLVDILNFSQAQFEKQIELVDRHKFSVVSKWPLVFLGQMAEIKKGKAITQKDVQPGNVKVVAGGVDFAYLHSESNRLPNTITVSASGASAGFVNFWKEAIFASDCSTVRGSSDEHTKYLFHILQSRQLEIQSFARGAAQPHVYPKDISSLLIPNVDGKTQKLILNECNVIDFDVAEAEVKISGFSTDIEYLVNFVYSSVGLMLEVDKLSLFIQYGLSEKMNEARIGFKTFRMNEIIQGRMIDNGTMKCANISEEEFAKYKLNLGDVLFNQTNSIEHVGKTGLFELEGDYCFASYLVRVVPDVKKILPLFLTMMMNSKAFQQEAKGKASKSINQANINATIMRNIKVPVPPLAEQKRFVAEIQKLEQAIAQAQAIIAAAPAKKQAIMQKYL